jgi:hypothetical protein
MLFSFQNLKMCKQAVIIYSLFALQVIEMFLSAESLIANPNLAKCLVPCEVIVLYKNHHPQ